MTIREYLKRRTRRIMVVGFGGWLLLPLSMLFSEGREPPVPLFLIGFALFGGAILSLFFLLKCPRCKTRFGQIAGEIAVHWGTRARVNFCPYCGVNLDEPLERLDGST